MAALRADQTTPRTIDEYIAAYSPAVQSILQRIRVTIRKAAPDAEEKISYQLPAFTLNGPLVHFGAFKHHIGLFPPVRDEKLRRETSIYAGEKGNLRFPLDKPIPYALISRVVTFRVQEQRERLALKRGKKSRQRANAGQLPG